jgi:hypothetical protein
MDAGKHFSIAFITCDRKKQTGGEWIFIDRAVKHDFLTRAETDQLQKSAPATQMFHKNPNHYQNSTRNIRIIKNSELRKIHIRLITEFNGMVVT